MFSHFPQNFCGKEDHIQKIGIFKGCSLNVFLLKLSSQRELFTTMKIFAGKETNKHLEKRCRFAILAQEKIYIYLVV
jgi:hypothetical protein